YQADGSDLPRARKDASLVEMFREKPRPSVEKGKQRDVPPHMMPSTSFAGLQLNGVDVDGDLVALDTPRASVATWKALAQHVAAQPATRSQTRKEVRFDPAKRTPAKKTAESSDEPQILKPTK
ncbi:hypothetical protein H0H93_005562, partial [Arthromyces matolae]